MIKTLKYLSYTGLLALALPTQAASVIIGNNSFVEGYLYVEDTLGNSFFGGAASYSPPSVYATDFWDDQGGAFDGYHFPVQYDNLGNPIVNASNGWAGGGQNSIYDVDHFYGDGYAGAEVIDPGNELSFIQLSGESLVYITFEILTGHTYTLTGDLIANPLGNVDLFFDGNSASELDGAFSFSGYLTPGTYTLSIDALAAINASQYASSGYNYDLTLTAVPIPAAIWLFGSGLIGLIGIARRKERI